MSLNSMFAAILLVAIILLSISKLPHLFSELNFYRKQSWDLKLNSEKDVWQQASLIKRFPILSLGAVKLLVLSNQVAFAIIILIFWISAGLKAST
jgi:hypothetical protein